MPANEQHTPCLLVVDDEEAFRTLIAGVLSDEGYDVDDAASGTDAMKAIRNRSYDLVLLDMKMPGVDGMQVLQTIRKESPLTDVIMITGYQDIQLAVQAIKMGATEFLSKPLNPFELVHRVKLVLDVHLSEVRMKNLQAQFTSRILHELLTPLRSIRSSIGFLGRETAGPLTERQRAIIQSTDAHLTTMEAMLNDMIDLSLFESGRVDLEKIPTNLDEVIPATCERFKPQAGAKEIALKVEVAGKIPTLEADPSKIEQVMNNLLENAIKYTAAGGRIGVRISSVEQAVDGKKREYVEIAVSDTGQGIPAAEMPYIFDKYKQFLTDTSSDKKTTGLGLAICKSIVEGHKGTMYVTSEVGKGSTFRFLLPVQSD